MKKKLSREFKIGAFVIAMVAVLYFGVNYILSNKVFSSDQTFYATFDNADGLETSAPVMTKGFRIGTVEKVALELYTQKIIVTFSVSKEYPLPVDSRVVITTSGLMGSTILDVDFGSNHQSHFANRDTIPSKFEPGIMQIVSQEYGTLKEKITGYAHKIDNMLSGIESLFDTTNVSNLKGAIANMESMTSDVALLINNRRANIESMLKNLDQLVGSLSAMTPDIQKSLTNLSAATESLPALTESGAASFASLQEILLSLESGEGTMGMLLSDDKLYTQLVEALQSTQILVEDINENPSRYVNIEVFERSSVRKAKDSIRYEKLKAKGKI
ncbi:MAG: MlaD family protein [Rikenellaceae bacterium]